MSSSFLRFASQGADFDAELANAQLCSATPQYFWRVRPYFRRRNQVAEFPVYTLDFCAVTKNVPYQARYNFPSTRLRTHDFFQKPSTTS